MSRFIKTASGFINQDHILLIRFGVEKEEGEDLIQMSDGRTVQTRIEDFDWLAPDHAEAEQNRRRTMVAATEPEPAEAGFGAPRERDPKPKYADEPGGKTEV